MNIYEIIKNKTNIIRENRKTLALIVHPDMTITAKVPENAVWFHKSYKVIHILTTIILLFIIMLTIIAYFFRKEYWLLGF